MATDPPPKPPGDPLIDQVFDDRYRLVERIGAGGMGTVYRARQLTVDRDVAIKLLRADAHGDARQVRRFEREAQMIARLRDPHTLKLIDTGRRPDGQLYLVCEYLEGQSLAERLEAGPLDGATALRLLRPVCDALSEAHAASIVHRDLKPGNLFVERVGGRDIIKVLDFGIARWTDGPTTTGISGTPAFMAPEQAMGEAVDHRADLYAFGAVLYTALAGRPPFTGSAMRVMVEQLNEPPPAFDQLEPPVEVPGPVAELVFALLDKAPDRRIQTAAEVGRAIDALLAGGTLPDSTAPTGDGPAAKADTIDAATTAVGQAVLTSDTVLDGTPSPPPAQVTPRTGLLILAFILGGVALLWLGLRPVERPVAAAADARPTDAAPIDIRPTADTAPPDAVVDATPVDPAPPDAGPPDAARRPSPRRRPRPGASPPPPSPPPGFIRVDPNPP